MSTVSSREFNRDVSAAKRAAENEPVIVTDYRDLVVDQRSVVDRLAADDDLDLDTMPLDLGLRVSDL